MNIYEKLLNVQTALKAPKGQYNSFGKYNYRNCEDILESVKPLCASNKAAVFISDELVSIGDRYYVKATVFFIDTEKEGTPLMVTAYAREEADKKGMDGSQITGASSSYARKYALNGLFCIDDTKDSDTTNVPQETAKPVQKPQEKKVEQKPEPKPEVKQEQKTEPVKYTDTCPVCGKKIPPAFSQKQNRELSGAEIIAGYGGMCRDCYQKAAAK